MSKIKKLEDSLISMIAAGEIIERPASIIKELVENAIDAGSSFVTVRIGSDCSTIEIQDNGEGIASEDIELAFTQHATSKLKDISDLQKLYTLGFRGEALSSIASIAVLNLDTTTTEEHSKVTIEFGKMGKVETSKNSGEATGTSIKITQIFDQVPARKKFLKANQTEFRHCELTLISIALAFPQVHFELYRDKELIHRLPGTAEQLNRIHDLFAGTVSKKLLALRGENEIAKLSGFIGSPSIARKDTKQQWLFINNRSVSDKLVQSALHQAYLGFIHRDLRPAFFINIEIDPSKVDINIHPRKQEVRIEQGERIFSLIYKAVRSLLEQSELSQVTEYREAFEKSFSQNSSTKGNSSPSYSAKFYDNQSAINPPAKESVNKAINFSKQLLSYSAPELVVRELPTSHKVSQVFNTYIVVDQGDKLIFVDQHAAAEKLLYDKLKGQNKQISSKPLLLPVLVELEIAGTTKLIAELQKLGFELAPLGEHSVQVYAVPELLPTSADIAELTRELARQLDVTGAAGRIGEIDHLLATVACHGAIRAGQSLSTLEMQQLVADILQSKPPHHCPHGRPVMWELGKIDLEKHFKRSV